MNIERLEARVKAVNRANAYAGELYDKFSKVFANFVGQKVIKADGTLLKKITQLLPAVEDSVALHVYKYDSNYSLVWIIKTCQANNGIAHYHETSVYIGEMQGDTLTKLCNRPELRSDYTLQEIVEKRAIYEKAQKIADDAKSALFPFGEYDR